MVVIKNNRKSRKKIFLWFTLPDAILIGILFCIAFAIVFWITPSFPIWANVIIFMLILIVGIFLTIELSNIKIYIWVWRLIKYNMLSIFKSKIYKIGEDIAFDEKDIKGNCISKIWSETKEVVFFREIYELSGKATDLLKEIEQNIYIENYTMFFNAMEQNNCIMYSLPIQPNYQKNIEWMVDVYKNSKFETNKNIKTAQKREINFMSEYVNNSVDFSTNRIFLVFTKDSKNNRAIIKTLKRAKIDVRALNETEVLEFVKNVVGFQRIKFPISLSEIKNTKIDFKYKFLDFKLNKKKHCAMAFTIYELPNSVGYYWLKEIFENIDASYCLNIKPLEYNKARKKLEQTYINSHTEHKSVFDQVEEEQASFLTGQQISQMVINNETMFDAALIGIITGTNFNEVRTKYKELALILRNKGFNLDPMWGLQKETYLSFILKSNVFFPKRNLLFLGNNALGYSYPFENESIIDDSGYLLGLNEHNGEMLILDYCNYYYYNMGLKNLQGKNSLNLIENWTNSNAIVLGKIGFGKSFFVKNTIVNSIISGKTEVNVIDPQNEYGYLVENLGGKKYDMVNYTLNIFDVWDDMIDDEGNINTSQIRKETFWIMHLSKVIGFFKVLFPGLSETQNEAELSVFQKMIQELYKTYKITPDNYKLIKTFPTIGDFYKLISSHLFNNRTNIANKDILALSNEDSIYQNMLIKLEPYISNTGFGRLWNGQTNLFVDDNVPLNVFNVRELLEFGNQNIINAQFFLMLKFLNNRISNNQIKQFERKQKGLDFDRFVFIVLDELDKILSETVNSVIENTIAVFYKTIRKFLGWIWIITQDVLDLIARDDSSNNISGKGKLTKIINNCQFWWIFKMESNGVDDLNQLFKSEGGLTEGEKMEIIDSEPGSGLLVCGKKRIKYKIEADSYFKTQIWTNKISESEIDKYISHYDDLDSDLTN